MAGKLSIDDIRRTDGSFSNFIAEGFYHTSPERLTALVENYQAEFTDEERKRIFERPFVGPGKVSYQFSIDENNKVSIKEVSRDNSSDMKENPQPKSQTSEKVDASDFQTDIVRNSRKRKGQELAISEDHRTVSQSISLEKAGMKTPQTFFVTTHNENLLSVTQDGKMVASFKQKDDGSLQMIAAKEFVESINNAENLHLEGNVDENGNYVFDMTNLKLTKSGNLDTGEVRANNTAFAIMFSALGSQIRDAAGNSARQTNTEKPFDITVSTNFIKYAVQEKNGCTLEMEEPIFSAIMISRIHLARETFKSGKTAAVHLDLQKEFGSREATDPSKNVVLHSIPIFRKGQDEKNPEYLNIMQHDGKSYLYVQTRNAQNRLTAPQFYEINNVSLQVDEATNTQGLYFGLGGTKTTDIFLNLNRSSNTNSATNNKTLEEISKILKNEVSRTQTIQEEKTSSKQQRFLHGLPVHPVSTSEPSAEIVSFGNVRELERTTSMPNDLRENLFHSNNSDNDGQPSPTPVVNEQQEQTEQQNFVSPQPQAQEEQTEQQPAEQQPQEQTEQQPQEQKEQKQEEKPAVKKQEKKWEDLEINPPNSDIGKTLAALFMLSILVMIMIPIPIFTFWIPLAIGLGAVANLTHPINTTKKIINWAHHRKERKEEKQKFKKSMKELRTSESEQKMEAKIYKINKKIDAKKALIASYQKYKDKIDANPKAFMKKHRGKNAEECINETYREKIILEQQIIELKEKDRQKKTKADEKAKNKIEKYVNKEKNKTEKKEEKKMKKQGLSAYALPEEKREASGSRRAKSSRTPSRSTEREKSAGGRSK